MGDVFYVSSIDMIGTVVGTTAPVAPTLGTVGDVLFWDPSEAFNNKPTMGMKWCVCDAGATASPGDGTGYRAISLHDQGNYERGWWSAEGLPQWVQADWTTPRLVNRITLNTMVGYPNMAGVVVEYNSGGWVTVFSGTLLATQYYSFWDIDPVNITGLRVTVTSTYGGNWARISELNAINVVDMSADIMTIEIQEVADQYDSTVPIGTTAANSLNMTVSNMNQSYNQFDINSDFGRYLAVDNKIEVSFGVNTAPIGADPVYVYTKMGEFYTDEWTENSDQMTISVTARDFSKFLQQDFMAWGKLWAGLTARQVVGELVRLMGLTDDQVVIVPDRLNTFDAIFIDQQPPWDVIGQLALADQAQFRFDRDGKFRYQSYLLGPDASIKDMGDDTNIINANIKTQIHSNKIRANIAPFSIDTLARKTIWECPNPTILSWSRLASPISPTDTTIPVTVATRQTTNNLDVNAFPLFNGFIFLPRITFKFVAGKGIPVLYGGELIKYHTRTTTDFLGCQRGFLDTAAQAWDAGAYIGEARYFDMEFSNAPVLNVQFPFVTAIDELLVNFEEGVPQAYVVHFEADPYRGKLVVANIVEYFTFLAYSGETMKGYDLRLGGNQFKTYNFITSIAGYVPNNSNKQRVGSDQPIERTIA